MGEYLGVAEAAGVSRKEIATVQSIVMAVSGGRVRAQFREARARRREQERKAPRAPKGEG